MIEITEKPGKITISGHAGYAERGKDIVCAAVSALAQTLARSLDMQTHDVVETEQREGYIAIKYMNLSDAGKNLVDSFFVGMEMIAHEYPEHVTIKYF